MKITNKKQMFEMLRKGEFGNTLRTWDINTPFKTLLPEYSGPFGLRYCGKKIGKWFRTGMTLEEMKQEYRSWIHQGVEHNDIVICEHLPMEYLTFQGEVWESELGIILRFHEGTNLTHRDAMKIAKETKSHQEISTLNLLDKFMDFNSYFNTLELLKKYPGCVIEFSCCDRPLGSLGWNTIFWEVRHY